MRKLLLLLLGCMLLTACAHIPRPPMADGASASNVPAPAVENLPQTDEKSTLWFRFGTEPFLAPEGREIPYSRSESYPLSLLRALLEGPSASSIELNGLFPQGTRVISVTQSGRMIFVTLSKNIMNGYPDEPAAWRDQSDWAIEVPLRRELAMQSIAATLTENCDVDQVVILVETTDTATDSLRLRRSYYTLDGDPTLADPLTRDESLLLTPSRTAEVILACWQEQDYARLYRYLTRTDRTGQARPDEAAFIDMMASGPTLLRAEADGGNLHADGGSILFTVSGAWLDHGAERPFTGMTLRLTLEKGLWRVGHSQLLGREATP